MSHEQPARARPSDEARAAPTEPEHSPGEPATAPPGPPVEGTPTTPQVLPEVPGYEILAELGRGGMGVVYRARQLGLNRTVALKMILAGAHAGAKDRARFQAEAQAAAGLQHPHIVQIYEIGEHQGLPFFSLEYCPGGNLAQKLRDAPLSPREAARLVESLTRAVHAAHQARVIHRDLKPANVLLAGDGTPKISDFGLAKRLDEAGQTTSGAVRGTPGYMAPEQATGKSKDIGPAADVYGLGAILYECLTGQPPFKGETLLDTLEQVRSREPVPPRRLRSDVPKDLETVCLRCLHKEPRGRYASALDLAEDLRRFQAGEPIVARSGGTLERALKWVKRRGGKQQGLSPVRRMVTGVAVGMVLGMAAGAVLMLGAALLFLPGPFSPQGAPAPLAGQDPPSRPAPPADRGAQTAEQIDQDILTSTVWVRAKRKKAIALKEVRRPEGRSAGLPAKSQRGKDLPTNLIGTLWSGTGSPRPHKTCRFLFWTDSIVFLDDYPETVAERYERKGEEITIRFLEGWLTYTGKLAGRSMGGTATNTWGMSWTWSMTQPVGGGAGGPLATSFRPTLTGSGSLVDCPHRLVLTTCRVAGDADDVLVYFPDFDEGKLIDDPYLYKGRVGVRGKVIMREERADLALVQLDRLPAGAKGLALAESPRQAQRVYSLGNVAASDSLWVYSVGKVRRVFRDRWTGIAGLEGRAHVYDSMKVEIDSSINPGDSGGPLVNDRGRLVGVAHGTDSDQTGSIFIDVSEVRDLLRRYYQSRGEQQQDEP
jgi:S1-C subfamily serine protease